jgi:hypothetical protein
MCLSEYAPKMNTTEFFRNFPQSRILFEYLLNKIRCIDPFTVQVQKSQIQLRRQKSFAILWAPARYLRGRSAPLVLTLSFPFRHPSPRWKEIVEISPRRFTHHLELFTTEDIDDEICEWIFQAWKNAA